jgi:hypothetical protein
MGLGGTAKKIQKVADAAEKLYAKMNEIIGELKDLREEVEDTSQQVDRVERDVAEQRALVEVLADRRGIDIDEVLAEADLPPDPDAEESAGETIDVESDAEATDSGEDATANASSE